MLWGGKVYFGGAKAPKCTLVAPGLLLSFGAQSSLGGRARPQNFRLGEGPGQHYEIKVLISEFEVSPAVWNIAYLTPEYRHCLEQKDVSIVLHCLYR